ncbi:patatin-like phospholipase family protein [Devosia sp.]|uniref:patatin-like phospholipase family protein n=1 Tax=Devosia sp. TaxID=1871048 RepID=UPI003A95D678
MRIGVALGSGAARGLAHIAYIEALDELGLKPAAIAGASIGGLIGAGWANGMTGAELRAHAYEVLGSIQQIASTFWSRNPLDLQKLFARGLSVQPHAVDVARTFLPVDFPDTFEALKIPFKVVATDYHDWREVVFDSGPLVPAIAASMAIPSLFRPAVIDGRYFVDGGVTNPLPVNRLEGLCDMVIGIDVQRYPDPSQPVVEPSIFDAAIGATEIMSQRLVDAVVRDMRPYLLVRAEVGIFGAQEFWRVREIVESAAAAKDDFKRAVEGAMAVWRMEHRLSH